MKRLAIIILMVGISVFARCQITDALKIVGNVLSEASTTVEEAQKWEKLYKLISHSVCMERNYSLYYKFYVNNKDCFLNLDIERTLNGFDNILNILNTTIASRLTKKTTSGIVGKNDNGKNSETKIDVDELLVKVENAIVKMEELNRRLYTGIKRLLDNRVFTAQNSNSGMEISQSMRKIF